MALTTTASGLQYEDTTVGEGAEATKGQNVSVHYTGWLYNNGEQGAKFDSSRDRNDPFEFALGAGMVIKGWDEGVQGMKIGGQRTLIIPAALGYGARGAGGVIPRTPRSSSTWNCSRWAADLSPFRSTSAKQKRPSGRFFMPAHLANGLWLGSPQTPIHQDQSGTPGPQSNSALSSRSNLASPTASRILGASAARSSKLPAPSTARFKRNPRKPSAAVSSVAMGYAAW